MILESSIVWGNAGKAISLWGLNATASATFSCVEGPLVTGEGNINDDPLFGGWEGAELSASNTEELGAILDGYSLELSAASPCLGKGLDGTDMGSSTGTCDVAGPTELTIHLGPGTCRIPIFNLAHQVSLEGEGQESTTLEGTVLGLRTGSHLSGVTVTGGQWGGIRTANSENPEIRSCTITENREDYGSGVGCWFNAPTLIDCNLSRNHAERAGGGVYCFMASPTLTNCTISENTAMYNGGGVACHTNSYPKLIHCTVAGNASVHGGGIFCIESIATLESSIVYHNAGRAIRLEASKNSSAVVRHSCIEGGWSGAGNIDEDPRFGAWGSGEFSASDPDELMATLDSYSFALSEESPCLGTGLNGTDMGADTGTCNAAGSADLTIHLGPGTYPVRDRSLAARISIEGSGEDETVLEGTLLGLRTGMKLSRVKVTKGLYGGVRIGNAECPEISLCTITGNQSDWGGGVSSWDDSAPVLKRCTIMENRVYYTGGGLHCQKATPRLENCVIFGNEAGEGGAVSANLNSFPELRSCTISKNRAANLGGVFCSNDSTPLIGNSIVWDNWPPVNSPCALFENSITAQDPLFVDAASGDFHLQANSPAIDAGDMQKAPPVDRDGFGRPCGSGVDIGAYEFGECPPPHPFQRGDPNADGVPDIGDAILMVFFQFLGAPIGCEDTADVDDNGAPEVTDVIYLLTYLFLEGPAPRAPFPDCDIDFTIDLLSCDSYTCP